MNQVLSKANLHVPHSSKVVAESKKFGFLQFFKNEVVLWKYQKKYKNNLLEKNSQVYSDYLRAVYQNRFFVRRYASLRELYNKWIKPIGKEAEKIAQDKHKQILRVLELSLIHI